MISYVMFAHASYILIKTALQKSETIAFQQHFVLASLVCDHRLGSVLLESRILFQSCRDLVSVQHSFG